MTSQMSRWSGRIGSRALRVAGRTATGIAASVVAILSVVGEGFYDIGVAAIDATSGEENCGCGKR